MLYAINGGRDRNVGRADCSAVCSVKGDYLTYEEFVPKFEQMMRWLAKTYVNALKIIHYMHDKYDYEAFEMALHDGDVERTRATGIAGLSIVADSIAAMKHCKVRIIRDESGLAVDYKIEEGEYVPFGNNNDETDEIAVSITRVYGVSASAPHIPRRHPDTEPSDHHLQRGVRP